MAAVERKARRTVRLCRHARQVKGGHPKLWAFGVKDLAVLLRVSEGAARQLLSRDAFDPTSLESVCMYWVKRHGRR